MKLPGGIIIRVQSKPRESEWLEGGDGACDYERKKRKIFVSIADDLRGYERDVTVIHELVHAMNDAYHILTYKGGVSEQTASSVHNRRSGASAKTAKARQA